MKKIILSLLIGIFVASCKTDLVYISVINPSPVTISKSTKNVGIISRTTPSDDNKTLNAIRLNKNGQTLQLIKDCSSESIKGLNDALIENKRFDIIKQITEPELKTPTIGTFPSKLTWLEVEKICKDNNVDILFVLEIFDTELKVIPLTATPAINNPMDIIGAVTQAQVNIVTTIKIGWRIYDPQNKYVIDEFPMSNDLTFTANAVTVLNTVEALLGRKEAIKQSANGLGNNYATRIIPYWTSVTRDYFVKGTPNFKLATRKAQTGNWDGAGELWLKETTNKKRKIAGRAHYNMAILNEINGELDEAINWAQKAYENYNNKLALDYVNKLRNRKKLVRKLDYQLEK